MSFISDYVTPFFQLYTRSLDGEYIATQLQFKGSKEAGGDYINKIDRAQRRAIQNRYDDTLQAVKEPTFSGFFQDNLLRLLLNPFDRLIAAYQAYPSLKARFSNPGTLSHTFTEIMNEGVIFGAFKGFIFNLAQFGCVLYPSVYLANKNGSDSKYISFISTYSILDAIFYPVDTLKNILYADTFGQYSLKTVTNKVQLFDLYKGLPLKLAYNIPVLSGIYCTTQVGYELHALACWTLAALLYPLNTFKVRNQLSGTHLSTINSTTSFISHSTYRGVVPFILLNAGLGYCLRPLFSQQRLEQIHSSVKQQLKQQRLD